MPQTVCTVAPDAPYLLLHCWDCAVNSVESALSGVLLLRLALSSLCMVALVQHSSQHCMGGAPCCCSSVSTTLSTVKDVAGAEVPTLAARFCQQRCIPVAEGSAALHGIVPSVEGAPASEPCIFMALQPPTCRQHQHIPPAGGATMRNWQTKQTA